MNGGVNGMMEESKELSHTDSPEDSKESKSVSPDETDNDTSQCETVDSDVTNNLDINSEPTENPNTNLADNTNSIGSVDNELDECSTETVSLPPPQENSSTKSLNNQFSNSNESFMDTLDSQPKLESLPEREQELLTITQESMKTGFKIVSCSKVEDDDDDNERCKTTINGVFEEVGSEVESEDNFSEVSGEQRVEETVSLNSESEMDAQDETSQESENKIKTSDIIIMEDNRSDIQNGNIMDSSSPEVQEIISDNEETVVETNPTIENKVQLRRSSRAIKRKRYDIDMENGDYESDTDDFAVSDTLRRRSKAIVINDTKALVEMAAKQMKSGIQKKEPTVVIIDTNSTPSLKKNTMNKTSIPYTNSNLTAQNLYQSIVARGTTVTPVINRNNIVTQSSCSQSSNAQPSILPSLTDDMFVVEAPSFIVPYVYEKPSIEPFREFVDKLGNELKEQTAKEEEAEKAKEKEETEKSEKEKNEKKERGEEVEALEEEIETLDKTKEVTEEDNKQKKKEDKKERRRPRNDDDDVSWDGQSSTDTEDELGSDEETKTVVIKDKADVIEEMNIKDVASLTVDKVVTGKSDNYFDLSLGKFFMNIGLSLVQEYVQNDLLKQQNRKLYREKKGGHDTKITESSIASLKKNLQFSKENNAPYVFKQHKCEFCSFKSDSIMVMAHHLETPHMKNSVYKCNFCVYESRSPHDILYHMEAEHNTRGKLERAPAYHQCANCPFEDNGKGKLARHLLPCAKKFKPDLNLAPPIEWEPPAKIPKIARARNTMMSSYQNAFHRGQVGNNLGRPSLGNVMASTSYRPRGRSPMGITPRPTPIQGIPIIRSGIVVRNNTPTPVMVSPNYPSGANNGKNASLPKSLHQPSISITPLPRHPAPPPAPPQPPQPTSQNKSSCVICEICDGYIKDLEQLRNHMQWIHKVKIHPKMIYNRPPLNCQKCQFRFFTDQGLERHLLGSHGLVTSSMQEAANKGKDAGRCPVCGRVYQWKLLNHVARDHNLTLKPAHLSYKCTVCTATFGMYKQFENHVYSAHSVVAKRVMDKGKASQAIKPGQSLLKPLKINDEITIIPQPVKSTTPPIKEQ